ncbi:hypothetical protein TWF718_009705 [Orbilia javanica]|uniref:Uncharacterized protein n=1 Tax=Orbilia javanica TaxID=47235 RepID=A0AAN8MSX7_9PEZI
MAFSQVIAQNLENRKFTLESASFLGIAKIPLSKIRTKKVCDLDAKNISRLECIFRTEGCLRLDSSHHVGVIVDEISLRDDHKAALKQQSPVLLEDIPEVECIYGHHRLVAARKLALHNRWWVARVYRKGEQKFIYDELRDTFDNSQGFSDGEIFRRILFFQDDVASAKKWWARLTKTKACDLKQLLKLHTTTEAFKQLLPYRGLWHCIKLGSFHRLLSIKCTEEILHYLKTIYGFWAAVLEGYDGENLDPVTVDKVNSLDPRSISDRDTLEKLFRTEEIFTSFSPSERENIWQRLSRYCDAIPSLGTFFDDLKLLEACMVCIKMLLPQNEKLTVRQSMHGHLLQLDSADIAVELEESKFAPWSKLTNQTARCDAEMYFQCAYVQIWLYTLRNFPYISSVSPRKEKGQCKAPIKERNPVMVYKLAKLFKTFNIVTEQVEERLSKNPIEEYTKRLILDCSVDCLDCESSAFKTLATRAASYLESKIKYLPKIDNHYEEQEESVVRRTGRPFVDSFEKYRTKLYLPEVNNAFAGAVTALEAKKTFIRRFWDLEFLFPLPTVGQNDDRDSDYAIPIVDETRNGPWYQEDIRQNQYGPSPVHNVPEGSTSHARGGQTRDQGPPTQEPIAQEPGIQEAVAQEPEPQEPVSQEPVVEEQVAEEPVSQEPVVEERVAEEREVGAKAKRVVRPGSP